MHLKICNSITHSYQIVINIVLILFISIIFAACSDGQGAYDSNITKEIVIELMPPNNATAVLANNRIKISWDAVETAEQYNVMRSDSKTKGFVKEIGADANLKSIEIFDTPTQSDTYRYIITAIKGTKTASASTNEIEFSALLASPPDEIAASGFINFILADKASITKNPAIMSKAVFVNAKSGNDINEGTIEKPLKTINRAIKMTMTSIGKRNLIFVSGGSDYKERIAISYNDLHIFGGYSNDFTSIVGRTRLMAAKTLESPIEISNSKDITIDGIDIFKSNTVGLRYRENENVAISIDDSTGITISNNQIIVDALTPDSFAVDTVSSAGIKLFNKNSNIIIFKNLIEVTSDNRLQDYSFPTHGIKIDGTGRSIAIINNFVYSAEHYGDSTSLSLPGSGAVLINNILATRYRSLEKGSESITGIGVKIDSINKIERLSNNLIFSSSPLLLIGLSTRTGTVYKSQKDLDVMSSKGSNNITISPVNDWKKIFSSSSVGNLKLSQNSPAIGNGMPADQISKTVPSLSEKIKAFLGSDGTTINIGPITKNP